MPNFFNYFPKFLYNANKDPRDLKYVTNIIARFSFNEEFKNNTSAFYKYDVKDGETPEIIAHKFYDSTERHWIILLFNNIIDPQFDWPMSYEVLNRYVDSKYSAAEYADTANTNISGIQWAKNTQNIKTYYKTVTRVHYDGTEYVKKIEIDQNTYNNLVESTTEYLINTQTNQLQIVENGAVTLNIDAATISNTDICRQEFVSKQVATYYDYEVEMNESKRTIKLLKPDLIYAVEEEFKNKVNNVIT